MGTIAYTVPQAGTDLNSIADPEIATALTTIKTWANGNVDGANVVSSLTGRRLVAQASAFLGASAGASGNYFIAADGTLSASGGTLAKPVMWWHLDPATFSVVGKANTQLVIRMSLACGGAPAITVQGGLFVVTFSASGANVQPSTGTQAGSSAGISNPGAGSTNVAENTGGAFAFPSAGAFAPIINLSGTSAAASATSILWQLFVLNS